MSEYLALDTGALMNGECSFNAFDRLKPGCTVVITSGVLQELDRIKGAKSSNVEYSAREAVRRVKAFLSAAARINDNT